MKPNRYAKMGQNWTEIGPVLAQHIVTQIIANFIFQISDPTLSKQE